MSSPHLFAFIYAGLAAIGVGSVVLVAVVLTRDRLTERRRKPPRPEPGWLGEMRDDAEARRCACRELGID
jgi:hypothetical protein